MRLGIDSMNDEERMRRLKAWWKYHFRVCRLKRWYREYSTLVISSGVLELEEYETIEYYKREIVDACNEAEIATQRLFGMSYHDMKTVVPSPRSR